VNIFNGMSIAMANACMKQLSAIGIINKWQDQIRIWPVFLG
jgi:hypothetical protein